MLTGGRIFVVFWVEPWRNMLNIPQGVADRQTIRWSKAVPKKRSSKDVWPQHHVILRTQWQLLKPPWIRWGFGETKIIKHPDDWTKPSTIRGLLLGYDIPLWPKQHLCRTCQYQSKLCISYATIKLAIIDKSPYYIPVTVILVRTKYPFGQQIKHTSKYTPKPIDIPFRSFQ